MNLLTVQDVASRLQCSQRFVLDELRRKKMRGSKMGAGWRVDEADLEVYVASKANARPIPTYAATTTAPPAAALTRSNATTAAGSSTARPAMRSRSATTGRRPTTCSARTARTSRDRHPHRPRRRRVAADGDGP